MIFFLHLSPKSSEPPNSEKSAYFLYVNTNQPKEVESGLFNCTACS